MAHLNALLRNSCCRMAVILALVLAAAFSIMPTPLHAAPGDKDEDKAPLRFRVRVTKISPSQPAMIGWTYGGRGLSGDPVSGVITQELPEVPKPAGSDDGMDFLEMLEGPPTDRVIVKGDTYDVHYLNPGVWSRSHALRELPNQMMSIDITGHKTGWKVRDCQIEFEITYKGEVIKTFTVDSNGSRFGIIIPYRALDNGAPTPEFIKGLGSLLNHAHNKQELLLEEPWINWPTPTKTIVVTDNAGSFRTGDPNTILAEAEVMRLMGMNGYVNIDGMIAKLIADNEGIGQNFTRARVFNVVAGFPIPTVKFADNTLPVRRENDGCPYFPANFEGIGNSAQHSFDRLLENAVATGTQEVWGSTIDEIGNVFGRSNEGGAHPGSCSWCSEAFRDMVKADGRTLEDFGAASWDEIRPTAGYWAINYWESLRILQERVAAAKKAMEEATKKEPLDLGGGLGDFSLEDEKPVDYSALLVEARERLDALMWSSRVLYVPEQERKTNITEEGWQLMEYYSRRFMARTSGMMFNPLRKLVQEHNAAKQRAIDSGDVDSAIAKQPWLQVFGLRQPKLTWSGGSLGWFDYYRYADSAMVYETSNRDTRIYQWESMINDVGRSLRRFCGVDFGAYVKPHRGAPIQRALSAATRGSKMLYWYTYGPEWSKGDSFGGSSMLRSKVAFGSRLVAATDDVLVGGKWPIAPQVALVRPRTAEFFSGSASWENGKWLYMALAHAQIPMDMLDEILIEEGDLSNYKVIVIAGAHLRRKSAERLKQWVADGGTLYTCGYGMAKDEAGKPLTMLHEVFGVTKRVDEMTEWGKVRRYGATGLPPITSDTQPPSNSVVTGKTLLEGSFQPMVGCEILQPAPGAQVLATNSAGEAVAISNQFGQGKAYLIGTYAGMEYANDVMQKQPYDAAKRTWVSAPVLAAGVVPVVKGSDPLVEGVLVENEKTGKQAVALLNWHWESKWANPPLENYTVQFRGFGNRRKVTSVMLNRELPATIDGEWMTVTLPTLADADVLIVE